MDAREEADAAVRLLLTLERKVVLGDVHVEFAQQLRQHGERDPAPDQEPHERAQQARQGRVQLGWFERAGGIAGHSV